MSDFKSINQGINLDQGGVGHVSSGQARSGFKSHTLLQSNSQDWRGQFVLILLRSACVLGVILILLSFPTSTNGTRIFFVFLYTILVAITLLPVPYSLRSFSLVTIAYLIGMNSLYVHGPFIDGSLFLLAAVVLAGLLLESRTDILSLAIGIFTIIFFWNI